MNTGWLVPETDFFTVRKMFSLIGKIGLLALLDSATCHKVMVWENKKKSNGLVELLKMYYNWTTMNLDLTCNKYLKLLAEKS